jgi:hypothetical protein
MLFSPHGKISRSGKQEICALINHRLIRIWAIIGFPKRRKAQSWTTGGPGHPAARAQTADV